MKIYKQNCKQCGEYYEGYGKYFCSHRCRSYCGHSTETKEKIAKILRGGLSIKEYFWSKVKKTKTCWIWQGRKSKQGYGKIMINKKNTTAHRLSWEIHYGKIPEGLCICHHCDNPPCVNPKHLWLGTMYDNNQDKTRKGRCRGMKGEENHRSKLTKNDIKKIRSLYTGMRGEQSILATEFNVSQSLISCIVNKKNWKHI